MNEEGSILERIHFYEELHPHELEDLPSERTVSFLPMAPLQPHGPHLPLGTSIYVSDGICLAAAKEICRCKEDWHCLLLPRIPLGAHTYHLKGALEISYSIVDQIVLSVGASLERAGIRYLVVISSHMGPGHIQALEMACESLSQWHGIQAIAPMGYFIHERLSGAIAEVEAEPSLEREECEKDVHGGYFDTSAMLYLMEELVDPSYRKLKETVVPPEELSPDAPSKVEGAKGYLGYPAEASKEDGRRYIEHVVRKLASTVFDWIKGEDVYDRTHYPWPPQRLEELLRDPNVLVILLALLAVVLLIGLVAVILFW